MKVNTDLVLTGVTALYIVARLPLNIIILTAIIASIGYLYSKSVKVVLGVYIGAIFMDLLTRALKPAVVPFNMNSYSFNNLNTAPFGNKGSLESFQVKDPVTIHQRVAESKKGPPLLPKVNEITGVLESPNILDSLQISQMASGEEGASMKTLPASLTGVHSIRTPSESFINRTPSPDVPPRGNPYLQNGEDGKAVNTALSQRGSELLMDQGAGDVPGTVVGHSSV